MSRRQTLALLEAILAQRPRPKLESGTFPVLEAALIETTARLAAGESLASITADGKRRRRS